MSLAWLDDAIETPDAGALQQAQDRQAQLTKPLGALGELETVAIRLCALQNTHAPALDDIHITVFAADHGVATAGVSRYPQAVTGEMVRNFAAGGAAISVLARSLGAHLEVVDAGVGRDLGELPGVLRQPVAPGTADFRKAPAMSVEQLEDALGIGREAAERAHRRACHAFIAGEMGIGNTTAAAALASAVLDQPPAALVGPGTGLDETGQAHKLKVVAEAVALHQPHIATPLDALQRLGGFEIAALAGAYLRCAQLAVPVIVDGYIASVAALLAARLNSAARAWWFFAHASAEPGHARVLDALAARPLLDLGMRLGEGSGAAAAVPLMRLACRLHREMSTFAQAGVSQAQE